MQRIRALKKTCMFARYLLDFAAVSRSEVEEDRQSNTPERTLSRFYFIFFEGSSK